MAFFETFRKPAVLPTPETALPGRDRPLATAETHFVSGRPLKGAVPEGYAVATFALGCFWGAERLFWRLPGVYLTSVGYSGGFTENPTYEEVCSGRTGHTEAVEVVFDPNAISYADLVRLFFESHDPTQGMRQGNDVGTQYRSAIFVHDEAQRAVAEAARDAYAKALAQAGRAAAITTTIEPAGPYYFAEDYHQQYLAKNPGGYCGLGGTGVACPVPGVGVPS
ncbi:Peptide methionine sulfoxide reductase MsrA [Pleomorphomonas sp. T1.2MG-36]|uniref:peptide-methionine (S)-S-oxide reductase MsrA n=1 Tax=Pleomorphomonas sp. T1.2MG-36 TaxID=3041167 RepID=UPI002477BCAB|nr:peptide-methionine (S)-S-oxide reductase MsrA [Pleomorphomonas sp. T1.2MG-36]CAI9415105.1 Peptide methionine sulfoxide reductase MsrA [Pleomorphomonas sp. T1.2MG-36]